MFMTSICWLSNSCSALHAKIGQLTNDFFVKRFGK
jgi:hypothetical protein